MTRTKTIAFAAVAAVGLVFAFRRKPEGGPMLPDTTQPEGDEGAEALLRRRVVEVARSQIGQTDPSPYWDDTLGEEWQGPPPHHWCGAFSLWCLHQAGLGLELGWTVDGVNGDGHGFAFHLPPLPGKHNAITTSPQPGDVAYFAAPFQHHAIVASVDGDTVVTVDGNPIVKETTRKRSAATAYFSIQGLLAEAVA